MYELATRSLKLLAVSAMALTTLALSTGHLQAAETRSAMSVSVQVINPCEVTIAPDGQWISFGCEDAVFDHSTFSTAADQVQAAGTATSDVREGVEFVNVTY